MNLRIRRLQLAIRKADLDLYLVSHLPHIRYFCGFSGSNGLLLVSRREAELYTDGRYTNQAKREVKGAQTRIAEGGRLVASLSASSLLDRKHPRIGIQAPHLSVTTYRDLTAAVTGALWVMQELAEPLAAIKDSSEIDNLERAAGIVDEAFTAILPVLRPGLRELDVAAELEYIMLSLGSEGTSFETICASGARSALPHGKATGKKIASGDLVTLDYGARFGGYCSDITRTVVVGKASARQKRVYDIVRRALSAATLKVRPGASTRAVDTAARRIIGRAGYAKEFSHGTGHGLGLEVHEPPSLSARTDSNLAPGMVVTVEPGVYIEGFGGVRIEDDLLVTRNGHRVLTRAPRRLFEL